MSLRAGTDREPPGREQGSGRSVRVTQELLGSGNGVLRSSLLTKRTSTETRAWPATPTQKENTSHMEAAILGAPPP
ncbi:hypothetical protein P7K49_029204 [Saguinus oedipus]|uniref:Uncharacterized protein n=1 Tax=Saguinus oedipus TaxID=9490 RepID=A0ABQ9U6K0_SAGOE|nr:hypothetical protein P7K49_029204 [Saguinus oedipus]